jgi:hypothetical protein
MVGNQWKYAGTASFIKKKDMCYVPALDNVVHNDSGTNLPEQNP